MKKIAITMGEPGGIGPEVSLKAANEVKGFCIPVIIGDSAVMEAASEVSGLPLSLHIIDNPDKARAGIVNFIETASCGKFKKKGVPTASGGEASVQSIIKAVELAQNGLVDAISTAPISKEALRMAGYKWPGHTEMLAGLTGAQDYAMMLSGGGDTGPRLRIILATIHTALKNVPKLISIEVIEKTINLSVSACRMMSIKNPRIAVSGLNPHAGEAGMFGDEEEKIISPAIKRAKRKGIPVSGPYPPDTVFYRAAKGEFDMVVCMYHDQGLIPLKLLAFDRGVNVTVGLPIIRTSPDHGTAYDIAWKGMANPSSMVEAIKMAVKLKKYIPRRHARQ